MEPKQSPIPIQGERVSFGSITIGKQIGEGGFGVVHEATMPGINFRFAIKFLKPSSFNPHHSTNTARFLREAEILLRVRHPHIIGIYGLGENHGTPYILMELFKGHNLEDVRHLKTEPDPIKILRFVEQIAGGMGYAHECGYVHRDIKPRNLMADSTTARVLDFGLATLIDPNAPRLSPAGQTYAGDSYSAPELAENPKDTDPRLDVYSLGACWFYLLAGRAPKGVGIEQQLRESATIDQAYEKIILRCLSARENRYPSMADLIADVRALREGKQPTGVAEELTDHDVFVLAVIFQHGSKEGVASYNVDQEIRGAVDPIRGEVSKRRLERMGLIEHVELEGWSSNDNSPGFRSTARGIEWVEQHIDRVMQVKESLSPPPPEPYGKRSSTSIYDDDDIPF